MARGVNKVILIGNLGNDPEVRYSQSGNAITSISLATSESWKDKNGEQQERTEWHRVKFFGKLAEIAGEYLKKGRQVYIEGSIRYSVVEADGEKKYFTDIIADVMQMLGGGGEGEGGDRSPRREAPARGSSRPQQSQEGRSTRGAPSRQPVPAGDADPFPDDDIPF